MDTYQVIEIESTKSIPPSKATNHENQSHLVNDQIRNKDLTWSWPMRHEGNHHGMFSEILSCFQVVNMEGDTAFRHPRITGAPLAIGPRLKHTPE